MCSALVSVHGFKNELVIFMRSALLSVLGLIKELYSCVARLFRFID